MFESIGRTGFCLHHEGKRAKLLKYGVNPIFWCVCILNDSNRIDICLKYFHLTQDQKDFELARLLMTPGISVEGFSTFENLLLSHNYTPRYDFLAVMLDKSQINWTLLRDSNIINMILSGPNPDDIILGSAKYKNDIYDKYTINIDNYKSELGKKLSLYDVTDICKNMICYILYKRFLIKLYFEKYKIIDDISKYIFRLVGV
jgi:hypothetical protein